jgi:hypothetical protein
MGGLNPHLKPQLSLAGPYHWLKVDRLLVIGIVATSFGSYGGVHQTGATSKT